MNTALQSNWHSMIDARSRELHEIIAGKLRQNPALIREVEETLKRWLKATAKSDRSRAALIEWRQRLKNQPLNEILDFISSEGEEPCRLRQSTPFVGLLTDQERMTVFQKYEAFRG